MVVVAVEVVDRFRGGDVEPELPLAERRFERSPQLGEEQQYQLWLVKDDGERTGAALLSVDERGYGGGRVNPPESLFNYSAAEVTIEPGGGSTRPTTDVLLRATLFP